MSDHEIFFHPLTEQNVEQVLPFLEEKAPDISPEILSQLKCVFATSEHQCIALALMNRFSVNHPFEWCHGVSLYFQDDEPSDSLQHDLLRQASDHIIKTTGNGFLLGFSDVSDAENPQFPDSLFIDTGFKLLDTSIDYRGPVPFIKSPEYAYRRSHQDTLIRFDPEHPEDMDQLVTFANHTYRNILPNPRRRAERWLVNLQNGDSHIVYAKSPEGSITGMIEIICEKPPTAYVGDVMVSYRRMGTGLAIELSRLLEKIALELGATELSCHVADWNRASQQLIESAGLTPRGGMKRYLREFSTPETSKA